MLLFIDNIFRFVQAGSEVSALLGRMPSAVGYQPTLSSEMGQLQERITSTTTGPVTSVQAIFVPADDLTDPAPACAFAHLDSTTVLVAGDRREGHLSGRRSPRLDVASAPARHRLGRPLLHRDRRAADPPALQGPPGHHRDPRHGWLTDEDKLVVGRARRSSASSRSRTSSRSSSPDARKTSSSRTRSAGSVRSSTASTTSRRGRLMVGTIEDAVEKATARPRPSPRKSTLWRSPTRSSTSRW